MSTKDQVDTIADVRCSGEGGVPAVDGVRRQYRERGGFVPVVVEPDRLLSPPIDAGAPAASATGRIEIALADGARVIVDREVDGTALARVLSVLARR